jgi:hypothetical protein
MADPRLSPPEAARRRFNLIQGLIMVGFGLVVAIVATKLPQVDETWLRWLLAAIPVALLAWWAWEFYKMVRDDDEMMRVIVLRSTAISGVLVLLGGTVWGLLEKLLGIPPLWGFLLLPAFAVVYGVTSFIETRRM